MFDPEDDSSDSIPQPSTPNPASAPYPKLSPKPYPSNFLIPGLIPRRSLNLVIGPVKSGRVSLILRQLDLYYSSHQFLDYPLDPDQLPEQVGAIVCSRTFKWLFDKVRALNLDALTYPQLFPIESWERKPDEHWTATLSRKLDHQTVTAQGHRPRLLLIEDVQMMMPSGKINDPGAVNDFLLELQEFCSEQDIAILGTVGMAKMKAGEDYPLLQQRVMGSVQWANPAATLIGVKILDTNLPASRRSTWREITVMTSNAAPRTLYADFDLLGRLTPAEKPTRAVESQAEQELDTMLAARKPGEQFTRQDFLAWGAGHSLSIRTVDRWIATRVELGMLEKSGNTNRTVYWRPLES